MSSMSDTVFEWLRDTGLTETEAEGEDAAAAWLLGQTETATPPFESEEYEGEEYESEDVESGPGPTPTSIYLPASSSSDYPDYIRPATAGTATLLINGRSSGGTGPNVDLTEPLDAMQDTVQSLRSGDRVYLSAWFFEPRTTLTRGPYGSATTWGALFGRKATEGVVFRILINDFDPISGMDTWLQNKGLNQLNPIINGLSSSHRDNLKYVVSLHPASVGALKALLATGKARAIHIASHHQKFMVCRRGEETIAFCGGLDIESRKTPAKWAPVSPMIAWHDLHVKLVGPIARDLHREFVMRWNREKGSSTRRPLAGWRPYETLSLLPALRDTDVDMEAGRRRQRIQMLRTISSDAVFSPYSTDRDDVRKVYDNIVRVSREHLYLENQYFRSLGLADSLARAGTAHPRLVAIFVVVASAAEDDGENAITAHGAHLQYEFFRRCAAAFGSRMRTYTMTRRAVHSKVIFADDRYINVGSANANDRSFELDSELNVAIDDETLVRDWRRRLWAHNLGVTRSTVDSWGVGSFLSSWDSIATSNERLGMAGRIDDMAGEGVIPYDWRTSRGQKHGSIPDALAHLDFDVKREDRPAVA
jgi:phosphatidylserine/phosphatidylglycerophosphate/cardiolipin synthase-like enzyme